MRLFMPSIDPAAAANLKQRLESRGIPVCIAPAEIQLDWSLQPKQHKSLWIHEPEQYDDALAVVRDPDHVVAQPLDVDEYHAELDSEGDAGPDIIAAPGHPVSVFLIGLLTAIILGIAASLLFP